ncbi:MAG TPA: TonB-dependent receptor [Candidatus Paceibacterota bacterium]|nr:TonB-dependent receptor [Candidatus Paceibacterota bacterium]
METHMKRERCLSLVGKRELILTGFLFAAGFAQAADVQTSPPSGAPGEPDDFGALDINQLANVRITTATKRETPIREAPAIATVITADEIRRMGARNLLDVLKMVPGIGVSINEYGVNMVEVRGIRTTFNEKILLMIDGHSLNRNAHRSGLCLLADLLPVENIKQVEVVRGPGSALYGSSAFVATINIITRDADEISGVETKVGGGSFETFKGNAVAGKVWKDKVAVSASFDYFRTSGPELLVKSDALRGTPWSMAPGTVPLDVEQVDAFLKVVYGDFTFRGHFLTSRRGFYIGMGYAVTDENYSYWDMENVWGELTYNHRLSDDLTTTVKLSYDHFREDPSVKSLPPGFNNSFPIGRIGKPVMQNGTVGAEWQLDWDPFQGNHLIGGVAYEFFQQYDVHRFANFDPLTGVYLGPLQPVANFNRNTDQTTVSLYLQDEWRLLERIHLTGGVRYDHYSNFGDTTNPRAGLVWNVRDDIDLKMLYGQAFRAPNFQELYNINTVGNAGNPNLKPERIETFEAGITYRVCPALQVDLNGFHSTIEDLITRDISVIPTHYVNAGTATTDGLEAGLSGSAFSKLSWKLAYTYQNPRNDDDGSRLPYVPSHRGYASLNYALNRYLNAHADVICTGPRPRARGETRPEMPTYATVDLAVTARNFWKTLELQVTVHNLFDARYNDPDTSGAVNRIPGDFPREGISIMGNVTYRF